jgi:hypothetical protein
MSNTYYENICLLPIEIVETIYSYVPTIYILFSNKKLYTKYHMYVKKYIPRNQYENYIRDTIRRDNDFVFTFLMRENEERWLHLKRYNYKSTLYSNYIYFLLEYCIENDSDHCKQIVQRFLQESGLSKNQHKKNTHTNIRWTN